MSIFNSSSDDKLPYLDRIDEFEFVRIMRLKGNFDQEMVPIIQARIDKNRKKEGGAVIDKNIIVDFALVEKVDTAAIAFQLVRLEEHDKAGFRIGFVNVGDEHKSLLELLHQNEKFVIYSTEEEALKELNI